MRKVNISEFNLMSVNVTDGVIEVCAREEDGGNVLVKITQVAWDKICQRVIEDMEEGATLGDEVE